MKHLVYVFLGILALGVSPALATSKVRPGDYVSVTNTSSGGHALTQMPVAGYPTPAEILKLDEEKKRQQAEKGIPNPFEPQAKSAPKTHEEKRKEANVKHVYKGTPEVELKRQIQDPRIDDSYVQSLMRQYAK